MAPHLKRLCDLGHSYSLKVQMHCCGGIYELIPMMINAGLDGLHAVQPSCRGMDLKRLKTDFGDKMVFNGAIDSHHTLIEKDAAGVFNNAFTATGYNGGDGVSLCDGSHPYSPSNASTQDNEGTTALSYQAIVDTRELMRAFEDDRGELVQVNPDTLLVPPELEEEGFAIMRTMNKVDTADYHANFVASKLTNLIVWDYLTDANNWFLIDSRLAKLYLNWFDRVPLEFEMDPTSDFRLEARFRGYMRYSYGWSDWRWVYGHTVT